MCKIIVVIYNFLFWVFGLGILGVSLLLYVDSKAYLNFEAIAEQTTAPFFILAVVGLIMAFVGLLGCCGAFRENICLIGAYLFFLIGICAICLVSVYWTARNQEIVRSNIKTEFRRQIKEIYSIEDSIIGNFGTSRIIIDKIQRDFSCCGDKGIYDWHNSKFNNPNLNNNRTRLETGISSTGTYQVPSSCCKNTLAESECEKQRKLVTSIGESAVGLNRDGCTTKVEQFLDHKSKYILIIGVGLIGIQILAFTFSCCLCMGLFRRNDEDNLK